jgi:transglutaminase-like putative cysteine protease
MRLGPFSGPSPIGFVLLAVAFILAVPGPVLIRPAAAQQPGTAQAAAPSWSLGVDMSIRVNADMTGEITETRRIVVGGGAYGPQRLAQQQNSYIDGMQSHTVLAAFTEKGDGRRIDVDPAAIVTRDAAQGANAVYMRDHKTVTVIFPDVAVGDTLVMTTRKTIAATVFPGHFQMLLPLPRTTPYADTTIRVTAPAGLRLAIEGVDMEHARSEAGDEVRHVFTYRSRPIRAAEERMTSALDRDPRLALSTFADHEELARTYWQATRSAIVVTPEIAALATTITRGVVGKAAQAAAISRWVKTNIRYVMIVLGTSRVVPNAAGAILKNRFGDCKDQAVLMSALLAARGIASEHVLVNSGAAYALDGPATLGVIDHVLLHLPELGVYDDPTASFASFGVLADSTYDKPVIHVSDRGAQRARTPTMVPDEHLVAQRTRLSIAADGAVSGESVQTATGIFATALRSVAASLQWAGLEPAATDMLRRIGTPGTGAFDIDPLDAREARYAVRARFAHDAKLTIAPSATVPIPSALALLARPGTFLLASQVAERHIPFTCLAGRQEEVVEIVFAPGLPLPRTIADRRVETDAFVYSLTSWLEGRVLTVRRDFISRVPGQVCPPGLGAEIAAPIGRVLADATLRMSFAAPPAPPPVTPPPAMPAPAGAKRVAVTGEPLELDFVQVVGADCTAIGVARVIVVASPAHGALSIVPGDGFVTYGQGDARADCNRRRLDGMRVVYRPAPGYLGPDSAMITAVLADGSTQQRRYAITVGPAPEPREIRRTAIAAQRTRIGFLHEVERDCAPIRFAEIRIVEPPRGGEAEIEPWTDHPGYARDSLRHACNQQPTEGAALLYRSRADHRGGDAVMVELVYPDGRARRLRYVIDIR